MHTDNLRKLAIETNDGVLRGPALDAADVIDRLRSEIERLTKERDYKQMVIEKLSSHIEKAEAERDEARAQVAVIIKEAVNICKDSEASTSDDPDGRMISAWFNDTAREIQALTPAHAKAAIRAIDPAEVLAKVPPAPAVPDDVAKLWQDTADNDDFCALFGLIPLRDTATGEAIMWQEKSGDFIDFAVALRDALETQADAVARLVKAVKNERHHKSAYDATPTDRRGYNGPKGQAYVLWCEARADVGTALKEIEASPCPAAGGAESV